MRELKEAHWSAALRFLTCIKDYLGKGLMYRKYGHVHVSGYSDSGYAGDREDRKSTTGIVPLLEEIL